MTIDTHLNMSDSAHFSFLIRKRTNLSSRKIRDLLIRNPSPSTREEATEILRAKAPNESAVTLEEWETAFKVLEEHRQKNISLLTIGDPIYPNRLRIIPEAPDTLFIRGNARAFLEKPCVAIVGTRKATEVGQEIAFRIAAHLAKSGWTIVSGLALGIDAAAHAGALSTGGTTVCVLAHGLHKASPKRNEELAEQILASDGAWISEHPLGVPPKGRNFLLRNRIQTGLSAGSVIVESDIRSGSMAQARYCNNQERALFAVVPETSANRFNLRSEGTSELVASKRALPIRSKKDYDTLSNLLNQYHQALNDNDLTTSIPHPRI